MPLLTSFFTRAQLVQLILDHCEVCPEDFQEIPFIILAIALDSNQPLHEPLPLYQLAIINQFMSQAGIGVYPEKIKPRDWSF